MQHYKFYSQRPEAITAEFIAGEYDRLNAAVADAEASDTPDKWIALYREWNALRAINSGEASRRSHAFARDMNDPAREEADRYYRQQVSPVAQKGESALVNALIASRHREAVAAEFGPFLSRLLEIAVDPLNPINADLRVQAGNLSTQYMKIIAQGEVTVQGESMTLARAGSFVTSADESIRHESFMATRSWFVEHHDELAGIYDQLVKLRHQMALNLGHENYIRLGYQGMGRTDYGPEQVARFRENVRTYAVPVLRRMQQRQAARLGVETMRPWNGAYDPDTTLPSGIVPIEGQLDTAARVFESLSPRLAEHFDLMRREDLIDLENRKGKRSGAYCTSFADEGRVAILCNSTGDEDDVRTLMHEMGHAFQKWESQPVEDIGLQRPTSDLAEVHSMGMEYLSMPRMGLFFDDEYLERFRRGRWRRAVNLLCYVCVVDEFQHWVYAHPDATPAERDAEWVRITQVYQPGVDYSGIEHLQALRWYAQVHIFAMPFYYIDYALAESGAMQLALLDAQDHEQAMERYMDLCRIGGTDSMLNVVRKVGLRDPFADDTMRDLMAHAERELGLEDPVTA